MLPLTPKAVNVGKFNLEHACLTSFLLCMPGVYHSSCKRPVLSKLFATKRCPSFSLTCLYMYVSLCGLPELCASQSSDSSQSTIPFSLLVMMWLTYPLHSFESHQSAKECKQKEKEFAWKFEILCSYSIIELSFTATPSLFPTLISSRFQKEKTWSMLLFQKNINIFLAIIRTTLNWPLNVDGYYN